MLLRSISKCFKTVYKIELIFNSKRTFCINNNKPPWNVIFFGSDDFSVSSLKSLHKELETGVLINRLEVVTSTKTKSNAVSNFARKMNLIVHGWPIAEMFEHHFDIGIVVSFGHLIPNEIINRFHLGILNVHASLLPRWRGAAPIIYTIMNEDKETGVTVMRIAPKHFDIGDIVMQKKIPVPDDILMPDLYQRLAQLGSETILECLKQIPDCLQTAIPQPTINVTYAPKVSPNLARIDWQKMSAREVYAMARALDTLYPLTTSWHNITVKLYDIQYDSANDFQPGSVRYHKRSKRLLISCSDRVCISCGKICIPGKKAMSATDFYNGFITKEPLNIGIFL